MNLADSIFIFGLALIIFGPKKLPEIGRQIGKIMLEFRRASNEFKMQIEEELRSVEQADRQKQLAAGEAASKAKDPVQPVVESATSSSEALTVRPPSTGATESTESPYKPVSAPEEIPQSTASEPAATEIEPAASNLTAAGSEPDLAEPVSYVASEHQMGEHRMSEHQVSESQGLEEQATTHHG